MKLAILATLYVATATAATPVKRTSSYRGPVQTLEMITTNSNGNIRSVEAPLEDIVHLRFRGTDIVKMEFKAGPGVDTSKVACQPICTYDNGAVAFAAKFEPADYAGGYVNNFYGRSTASDRSKMLKVQLICKFY